MDPLFTTPTEHDRQIAERLVRDEWHVLAGYAWTMYQKQGRGMVVLNAHQTEVPRYLTDVRQPPFATRMGISLSALVAKYDPEQAAVIMITAPCNSLTEAMRISKKEMGDIRKRLRDVQKQGGDSRQIMALLREFETRVQDRLRSGLVARETTKLGVDPAPASEARPPIVTVDTYAFAPPPPSCSVG